MNDAGRYCVPCHGARPAARRTELDSYDCLMRGGEHGKVIIPAIQKIELAGAKIRAPHRP
jgi:hypothetical protein